MHIQKQKEQLKCTFQSIKPVSTEYISVRTCQVPILFQTRKKGIVFPLPTCFQLEFFLF